MILNKLILLLNMISHEPNHTILQYVSIVDIRTIVICNIFTIDNN